MATFFLYRTIRLLLDSRTEVETPGLMGLGIDREMALAIYRVGSEQEYAEVRSSLPFFLSPDDLY